MKIICGRRYIIWSSHITSEVITMWSDGTFSVESEVGWDFEHATLEEMENSGMHGCAALVDLIRRDLLTSAHDECGYWWTMHPSGDGFFRPGLCPTCGRR